MTQTGALADLLAKTVSTAGGLLSQMENALGQTGSADFSSLLSDDAALDASAVQALTPTQANVSQVSSAGVAKTASPSLASTETSSAAAVQNLQELASQLRNALAALARQNAHNAAANKAAQRQAADKHAGASGETNPNTDAATAAETTSNDPQNLAGILAQLLALTQTVLKTLQAKATAGGTETTASVDTAASKSSELLGENSPSDQLLQLIDHLEKTAQALQAESTQNPSADPTATSLLTTSQSVLASITNALADKAMAKNTQNATTGEAGQSADFMAQLENLKAGVKNSLTVLQASKSTSSTLAAAATSEDDVLSRTSSGLSTKNFDTINANAKVLATNEEKSRLTAAAESTTNAQASAGSPSVPGTPSQNFAASEGFTASVGKSTAETDFSSTSDMLGGKGNASFSNPTSTAGAGGVQATGTYTFASTLSALRATNGGMVGLPTAVDQVILQMNRSVKSGNDQMSLQLQPGDLGKITVKLDIGSDGKVQGTVTADNPQTLSMLQKDHRSLERALQDAGLRADPGSLQFNLGGQSGQHAGTMANPNGNAAGTGNGTLSADSSGDESGIVDIGTMAETYYLTPSGVNIQV